MRGSAAVKRGDLFVHGKTKKPVRELNGDLAMHGTLVLRGMHGMLFGFAESWMRVNRGSLRSVSLFRWGRRLPCSSVQEQRQEMPK